MNDRIKKTDDEWRQQLSDDAYQVCRQKGTERAFSGKLWDNHEAGIYQCTCCGEPLFASITKFDSGTGWPSYYEPVSKEAIIEHEDRSMLASRTEVVCSKCDAHLGHVFADGPQPSGLRYCINSVSLQFEAE